jgi:hypothetical protein
VGGKKLTINNFDTQHINIHDETIRNCEIKTNTYEVWFKLIVRIIGACILSDLF